MVTSLCIYRVKSGRKPLFEECWQSTGPRCAEWGCGSRRAAYDLPGDGQAGRTAFCRTSDLEGRRRPNIAHEIPDVMAVWEPMGTLCEPRDGRPPMEFPHVERIQIPFER